MVWRWITEKQIIQGIGVKIINSGRCKYEINLSLCTGCKDNSQEIIHFDFSKEYNKD